MNHIKIACLLTIIGFATCCAPPKELSNSEKVPQSIEDQLGKFDEVSYSKDSLETFHSYNGNAILKTKRAKNIIDKTLNLVGTELDYKATNELLREYSFGDYVWETPNEKITIRGFTKLGSNDPTSSLNLWIERK